MMDLLKSLYLKLEELKGKKLIIILLLVFISFTVIGIIVGYIINKPLNKNETTTASGNGTQVVTEKRIYEGKIIYINPEVYPMQNITYTLNDQAGKVIFPLRTTDQKLSIAENLSVKVSGRLSKLPNGVDVLDVDEVIIKNATN